MSLFANLMERIFGHSASASQPTPVPPPTAAGITAPTAVPPAPGTTAPVSAAVSSQAPAAASPIDVVAILDGLAAGSPDRLDWRKSIVDLMQLVGMDSGLAGRRELARELHYTGDLNDSDSMDLWLRKEVMRKLVENGGQIPQNLL
jgi:hypothetical protein